MSSTMSCLWDRTKNFGDLRFYLFENVVFVNSVAPITRLSYIPCCLLIYITLSYIVGQCSLLVAYNVTSPCGLYRRVARGREIETRPISRVCQRDFSVRHAHGPWAWGPLRYSAAS